MSGAAHFDSPQELIAAISARLEHASDWVLALDGEQQVGKTTLAETIAPALGAKVFSCDDFVTKGVLRYPDALDLEALSLQLQEQKAAGKPSIIEGVMLRLITDAVQVIPNVTVYVKHVSSDDEPTHPHLFEAAKLQRAIDADTEYDANAFPNRKYPSLPRQILDYHQQYLPDSRADYIFNSRF